MSYKFLYPTLEIISIICAVVTYTSIYFKLKKSKKMLKRLPTCKELGVNGPCTSTTDVTSNFHSCERNNEKHECLDTMKTKYTVATVDLSHRTSTNEYEIASYVKNR